MWMSEDTNYEPEALRTATAEEQYRVINAWFWAKFEDPAQNTPHDSGEGGYIYIDGGPYDAREQLEQEFLGIVPQEVIDELVGKLQGECFEWAPTSSRDDYDSDLYESVHENQDAEITLEVALAAIEDLLATVIQEPLAGVHRRLLFANVITALETFLSDTFINRVLNSEYLLQRYLDTERAFRDRKFALNEALRIAKDVTNIARKQMLDMAWHNIAKVKRLYADVLRIDLHDITAIAKAVHIRHDIVHRNGRQEDGSDQIIATSDVKALVSATRMLVGIVDQALNPSPVIGDDADLPF
jgi:hypothetical protein